MKAYIERPMTDMPEKEGYYTVIYTESTAGSDSFYFLDDEWFDTYPEAVQEHADPIDVDGFVWLQEIEIPDPSPVVNTDVLVAQAKIKMLEDMKEWAEDSMDKGATGDEILFSHNDFFADCDLWIERCRAELQALSQFTTPQPDKKEEKK